MLLSQATNAESDGIFSALKGVKTYLRWAMGNKGLSVLILLHVHENISDNVNLVAAAANEFVQRKGKQTFRYFFQNYS